MGFLKLFVPQNDPLQIASIILIPSTKKLRFQVVKGQIFNFCTICKVFAILEQRAKPMNKTNT